MKNHSKRELKNIWILPQMVLSSFLKIKKGIYAAIKGMKNRSLRYLIFSAILKILNTVKTTTALI